MDIKLEPGIYVVAVSGGVDSMALLHMLVQQGQRAEGRGRLIVAHFDHGIREDSHSDCAFVRDAAKKYGLPFIYDRGHLGPGASEDEARKARYKFLRRVKAASGADAIITAHHQDDLLETAILNLMRGTNRKGLSSLGEGPDLKRPLIKFPKQALLEYAKEHGLVWREDPTNIDTRYRRNLVRHQIINKLTSKQRQEFVELLTKTQVTNQELDGQLAELFQAIGDTNELDRKLFTSLPHMVAIEVIAAWLRRNDVRQFDKKLLERLVIGSKTMAPGKSLDVNADHYIGVGQATLVLKSRAE